MPGGTPRRRCFVIALTLLVVLQTATPVWSLQGRLAAHRVISRLAQEATGLHEAKAAIAELLEPGESLADASLWADENRGRLP